MNHSGVLQIHNSGFRIHESWCDSCANHVPATKNHFCEWITHESHKITKKVCPNFESLRCPADTKYMINQRLLMSVTSFFMLANTGLHVTWCHDVIMTPQFTLSSFTLPFFYFCFTYLFLLNQYFIDLWGIYWFIWQILCESQTHHFFLKKPW